MEKVHDDVEQNIIVFSSLFCSLVLHVFMLFHALLSSLSKSPRSEGPFRELVPIRIGFSN